VTSPAGAPPKSQRIDRSVRAGVDASCTAVIGVQPYDVSDVPPSPTPAAADSSSSGRQPVIAPGGRGRAVRRVDWGPARTVPPMHPRRPRPLRQILTIMQTVVDKGYWDLAGGSL